MGQTKRTLIPLIVTLTAGIAFGAARRYSPPAETITAAHGRYAITALGSGQYAVMVDSATGRTWYLSFANYCQGFGANSTKNVYVRPISSSDSCKSDETSFPMVPTFEEISVEGLHYAPGDPGAQLMRRRNAQ